MANQQPSEPPVTGSGDTLNVHSMFLTIQGEGPYSGRRAVFVRLAGCQLACPKCDTLYTEGREDRSTWSVLSEVAKLWQGREDPQGRFYGVGRSMDHVIPLVVLTGGEPLRQPVGRLCEILVNHGYLVQIESNGVCAPDPLLKRLLGESLTPQVKLVVSPKTRSIHPDCERLATAFKYVLDHRHVDPSDGLPTVALGHERGRGVARPRPGAAVYVTPMDETRPGMAAGTAETQLNMEAVARTCIRHGYIANVQLHKILGIA